MPHFWETFHFGSVDFLALPLGLLMLVVHYGPMAHSEEWTVYIEAKEMLQDILNMGVPSGNAEAGEAMQKRERVTVMMREWIKEPEGERGRLAFELAIGKPVETLAGFALPILRSQLESRETLPSKK